MEHINVFVFQLQMNSREREVSKIYHSGWILPILDFVTDVKLTQLRYNKGLKTGMDFGGLVWKQVWKVEYFGLNLGNQVAHPYQEFRGVPPPPPPVIMREKQIL